MVSIQGEITKIEELAMQRLLELILISGLSFSIAACSSTGTKDAATETGEEGAMTEASMFTDDSEALLSKRVIYFDFNSSVVKSEFQDVLAAHAENIAGHSDVTVVLEGHADERGTREYNIALGERRAKAIQQLLTLQGVAQSQLQVISFGEERPVAPGHDESAWSLNRRVELLYSE